MKPQILCLTLLSAVSLFGCEPAREPRYARLRDIGTLGDFKFDRPLVVEVDKGDTIPLHFKLEGPLMETPKDAPPIMLEATRHFYLKVDKNGLQSSLDGKDFGAKPAQPGHFQIGFGVSPKGADATIAIRTPMPHGRTN